MHTSIGDHLRALRRPAALAALAAAAGGVVAILAPAMAVWQLTARVQALDTIGDQAVTTLPGAEASPAAWVATAVGVVVVVVAALVAVDRPPPLAEPLLVGGGGAVVGVALAVLLSRPVPSAFAHRGDAAELVGSPPPLPTGVGIDLWVEPARGLWVLALGGVLVVAGALVALRRG